MPKIPIILTLVCFAVTMQHAYAEKPILCGTPSECYEYAMDKLQEAQELVKKQQEENQRLAKTIQDLSSTIQALANENKRLIKENQSAVSALQQKMAPVNISTDGKVSIGTTQSSHQLVVESQNENTLRLIGPSSRGSKAKLNFGDGDYVFLKEYEDDKLEIKANGGVKFTGRVNFTNLVDIESKGSLNAAQFKANQGRALYLESNGNDRSTLVVLQKGSHNAAQFQANQAHALRLESNSNEVATLLVEQKGSSDAAVFQANRGNALYLESNSNKYPTLWVEQKGSHNAAQFQANQAHALYLESNGNEYSTLRVKQKGSSDAAIFQANRGNALYLESNGNESPTLWVKQKGSNNAAKFEANQGHALQLESNSNKYPTLWVEQKGSAKAAYFKGDISTSGSKNFQIPHPSKPGYDLIHASVEGPESGVFYRGEAELSNGHALVKLPDYFEALTRKESRTVQLTAKGPKPFLLSYTDIVNGEFQVYGTQPNGFFSWEVKAIRADIPTLKVVVPHMK